MRTQFGDCAFSHCAKINSSRMPCACSTPALRRLAQLVPAMRESLRHCSRANCVRCLALLQAGTFRRDLLLDVHPHPHVPALLDIICYRYIV